MVSPTQESLTHGVKLSSVGPGRVSGQDVVHEPDNLDLAMKLHYIRGVYYFRSEAVQGLSIRSIKEPMFTWLNSYYTTCGRFRRSDAGRPYIKCNDCGVRFIEAHCVHTIDEWLQLQDISLQTNFLVSNQVVGPELPFSPLVLLQITKFKCGGMSVGLSWAHVLGDAVSASNFMNALGQVIAGHQLPKPLNLARSHNKVEKSPTSPGLSEDPLSVKRVDPVGDHWIAANNCKMEAFSFHVSEQVLAHLQSKVSGKSGSEGVPPFECLCAIVWQCVAKVRDRFEPKMVTICRNEEPVRKTGTLSNHAQLISTVKADSSIAEADPKELAALVMNRAMDERAKIEQAVERDQGLSDFIVYGANLTFVDLEESNLYGFEFKGEKPVYVSYTIDGVGDEGVVLVLPGPKDIGKGGGRIVTMIMPENQKAEIKSELKKEWSIA